MKQLESMAEESRAVFKEIQMVKIGVGEVV